MIRQLTFFVLLAIAGFASRAEGSLVKTSPFSESLDLSHIGKTFDFKVSIPEAGAYSLTVKFFVRKSNKFLRILDSEETPEEAVRLSKILGAPAKTAGGEWKETGAPVSFNIKVYRKLSGQYIFDRHVTHPGTSASYMGRHAEIFQGYLDKGQYDIKLEYFDGDPALFAVPAEISFGKSHHGK